ncbi:MAG TPA: hypothetical protein VHD76_10325 [Bryobacteraceae bacterium]|nr:hypothetical protein [Bryobacteraceae bacterium]
MILVRTIARGALVACAFGSALIVSGLRAQDSVISRDGGYWIETVRGSLPGDAPAHLRVQSEGPVVLRGAADRTVRYSVKKRVRARNVHEARERLRAFRVKTLREGNLARLEFISSGVPLVGSEVSLAVSRDIRLSEIETKAGSVSVAGMNGRVDVVTGAGRVELDRIQGEASARTGGGDVEIGRLGGPFRCYTAGGAIRIGSTGGLTRVETAGGDIYLQDAGGPVYAITGGGNIHVGKAAGAVSAKTSAGLIDVKDAGGPVVADTSGGVIEINSAQGAQCASTAGAIRLRNVNGNVRAATRSGSIRAELTSNPFADSTLSASIGDVTVFIPSNIAMTVMAQNDSAGALGRIVSDFPEIRVKLARSGAPGLAIAEGALNGGGPVLHISVSAGNIYLRRQP